MYDLASNHDFTLQNMTRDQTKFRQTLHLVVEVLSSSCQVVVK